MTINRARCLICNYSTRSEVALDLWNGYGDHGGGCGDEGPTAWWTAPQTLFLTWGGGDYESEVNMRDLFVDVGVDDDGLYVGVYSSVVAFLGGVDPIAGEREIPSMFALVHSAQCLVDYYRGSSHDCQDNAVPYEGDGPLGHGWECGLCGAFLQAG